MEIKNEEKFSSFTESIKQLDKQGFELMSDIKLLFDEISKVESSVDDTELKIQIESLKESIADIQLQKGDKGDKGEDGKNGLNGKDGKDGRDGIDGIDGLNGKDGEKGENGSPDTAEDIVKKINTLESVIERKTIKGLDNLVDQPGLDRALGILDQRTQYLINKTVVQPNLAGYVPTTRTLTINGVTEDLSADRTWSVGTVTDVAALTLGTSGTDLSSTVATGTTTPVITLNVPTASATNRGALSSTDWSTFNSKFTLPSLTNGSVLFSNGTTIAQDNANFFWDDTNKRLYIGSTSPTTFKVNIYDASSASLNVQTTLHQGLLFASNGASAIGFGSQTVTDFIIRTSGVERARIKANGAFGIGVTSATAVLHLKAGSATTGTAPLKFTSGTNLTTPEAGAIEYDGTSFFFTRSGTLRAGILMTDIASPYNTYTASAKGATAFTTGANNVLVGFEAGKAMTTSSGSVFIGQQAGNTVVLDAAGGRSVALGAYSGTLTATLYGGVFIGYAAGYNSTSLSGSVMIGQAAGNGSATTQEAIFIGTTAGQGASGATYTIALGYQAAFGATSASNSVFIGQTAGHNALSAASTIGIGNNAGRNAHGSIESIYMGKNSGYNSVSTGITGDYNLGLGTDTLKAVTTGAGNIALGYKVGDTATTGSKNVAIGYDIDYQSNTADGQLTIQNIIFGKGNTGTGTTVSTGGIGIGGEPDACAMLEVKSTTKGFLLPRMTETERDAIASPVAGLMIYNTTTNKANLYTTAWEAITSA